MMDTARSLYPPLPAIIVAMVLALSSPSLLALANLVPAIPVTENNQRLQGSWQVDPTTAATYFSSQFHFSVTTLLLGQMQQEQPEEQQTDHTDEPQWVVVTGVPGSGVTGSGRVNANPSAWSESSGESQVYPEACCCC